MTDHDHGRQGFSFSRDDYRRLSSRIKEMREERGWKQRELSLRAGIASDRLSRLERGAPVRLDELVGLGAAFGVPIDELVFEIPSRSPDDLEVLARGLRSAVPREDLPAVLRVLGALLAGFRALRLAEISRETGDLA